MLAIKQVPVLQDLQEIIKEISVMQQCDSPYIVKYYGSYFKDKDLWVSESNFRPSAFLVFNVTVDQLGRCGLYVLST